MAAVGEAPTLFLRKATGLVKGWSKFDAFLYSFMSVNFVTLGLFFACPVLGVRPRRTGASRACSSRASFVTFLVSRTRDSSRDAASRGRLRLAEPRARRRDRVRALAVTGWWFILWYWTPIYANILNVEVLQPLAAIFGLGGPQHSSWRRATASSSICVVTVLLAGYLVSLGMEGYAKIQKVCFYIGMAGAGRWCSS